ncbi:DNA-directed RNA polymerase subunit alpha [Candidatus Peribacteria bacterium]|nr:DNA-directed RNA polymerase subunit alpha [Candidatus Peribacteria bacterium]
MHIIHETIGAPHLKLKAKNKEAASIEMHPLPQGFGNTIGNAMRRVLYSSLPGTAVTAYKIEGKTHEYDTLEGVKETLFDIGLNLRSLRLRKNSKGSAELEVKLTKTGVVTAADIKTTSDVEILDPTQVIMTCDGLSTKQKMFIRVEKGVGSRMTSTELSREEDDPEYILLDAIFSPLTQVSYTVEPARVGDQTNLDKLVLSLETNGSITAEDAIGFAAQVLESYFSLFRNEAAYSDDDFTTSFDELKKQREAEELAASQAAETSFTPIDILGLSQRTLNALVNGGVTSVEQLTSMTMTQLMQLRGFGQKAKVELDEVLGARGYALGKRPSKNA